ncbi:MAG TPA: hypothetical protein VGB51_02720 [Actinomycetota bacterium]
MMTKLTLALSGMDAEIRGARTRLSILRDELGERRGLADELLVRSFIAETAFADREYRVAEARCRRLESRALDEEVLLTSLIAERERLGAHVGRAGNPGPEARS